MSTLGSASALLTTRMDASKSRVFVTRIHEAAEFQGNDIHLNAEWLEIGLNERRHLHTLGIAGGRQEC